MNTAMINNLGAVVADVSYGEKVGNGLIVVVVGMLAVFAVLAILWGVLALFKYFFYDMPAKKAAAVKAAQEEAKASSGEVVPVTVGEEPAENDTELIAVITAAIAAYNAGKGNALPFRVISYKRARGANGWNGAKDN